MTKKPALQDIQENQLYDDWLLLLDVNDKDAYVITLGQNENNCVEFQKLKHRNMKKVLL